MEIRPQPNWVLSVTADDGRVGTFDVGPYLGDVACADRRDHSAFVKGTNGGYFEKTA